MKTLFTLFLITFTTSTALAAQTAVITAEKAPIRESAGFDGKILDTKTVGEKVRISSKNKDGWYKIRASSGAYGWIWQADLSPVAFDHDLRENSMEQVDRPREDRRRDLLSEPWLFLTGAGLVQPYMVSEMSPKFGASKSRLYLGLGGYFDAAAKVSNSFRIALRLLSHSSTTKVAGYSDYDVSQSTTALLVGLQVPIIERSYFELALGGYAGFGFANTIKVTVLGQAAPNSFSINETSIAALANAMAKYWLSFRVAIYAELGLMYNQLPASKVATDRFNGDTPFLGDDGLPGSIHAGQLGSMFGLGLQIAF